MTGTFRPGDYLVIEPVPLAEIRPGDVVACRWPAKNDESETVAHRVMARSPGGLVTRGDNNPCVDTRLLTADDLLGRVTHVERGGLLHTVRGGRIGLLRAWMLRVRRGAYGLVASLGRKPYRWLRDRGLLRRVWRLRIVRVRLETGDGPLIKYLHGGKVVARWWPDQSRFECRKPYDLFLPHPGRNVGQSFPQHLTKARR